MRQRNAIIKWLTPGLGIKRWLLLLLLGITLLAIGFAQVIVSIYRTTDLPTLLSALTLRFLPMWVRLVLSALLGLGAIVTALYELNRSILAPFASPRRDSWLNLAYARSRRQRGLKVVAIGGGTGLPSVLRGLKAYTSHITAIVTVADDGGSSGKLRRELGILPPGDLRNNIAALANDEDLMAQLFQYRFADGGLEGHSFGNLFLSAMTALTGSMDQAVAETGRVLAIEGRVLPATLHNVTLVAEVQIAGESRRRRVVGESQIPEAGGQIEHVFLQPDYARAYPDAIRAILDADLVVIGPGSLFTSLLPTLLVNGIVEALRVSRAYIVYVCNVATQQGETDNFTVADHIVALEQHIGRNSFDAVVANNHYPSKNKGENTHYVRPASGHDPVNGEILQRYHIEWTDLTDEERPWRHDPAKLAQALLKVYEAVVHTPALPAQNDAVGVTEPVNPVDANPSQQ
ncbi:MAG: YvcK family protein [Anaerolineae bacterium]|nr:YvcK family protein [Anaerolineae bacterium]